MTPKEKAQELINKFDLPSGLMSSERKQCALIAVDEILAIYFKKIDDCSPIIGIGFETPDLKFWLEVEKEIEKL